MSVHDLFTQDHTRLRQGIQEVQTALEKTPDKLEDIFLTLQKEVRAHFRKEDEVYYPIVDTDKRLPDRALVHTLRNDHAAVIFALESLAIRLRKKVPLPEWKVKFETMQKVLLSHFEQEEKQLFPQAQRTLTPAEFQTLLEKIQTLA